MEDFEIVDLMETLEDIGLETQEAFKVEGHNVPDEHRVSYTIIPKGHYVYSEDLEVESDYEGYHNVTDGNKSYKVDYEYTTHETEEYPYTVNFKTQFEEHFRDIIKFRGDSYFYLDTSEGGIPSFTIWGNSSGIIKLRKSIKMKFPGVEIVKI
jgi:hypothetical protein